MSNDNDNNENNSNDFHDDVDNDDENSISLNENTEYKKKHANPRKENPVPHDKNKVRDGREINHMHQLSRVDKELVKVLFREAYLKCWRMDQIPTYIKIKTKINVTRKLVDSIKERQWEDDRFWFYELARDPVAYLGLYRDAIDKLTQLEKELWVIVMSSKIETVPRIMAMKEIHSIQKTMVLMLRDLPFITNLSKLYDINSLDPAGRTLKKLQKTKVYPRGSNNPDYNTRAVLYKSVHDSKNSNLLQSVIEKTQDDHIVSNILEGKNDIGISSDSVKVDADVIEDMRDQLSALGYGGDVDEEGQQQQKENDPAEEDYLKKNMAMLDEEQKKVKTEEEQKILDLKREYIKKMASIDSLISEGQWKDIEKIRELTEEDDKEENDT